MLDLNHPMTEHMFNASRLMDRAMTIGQRMSVSPTDVRMQSLSECPALFDEMRTLARTHFVKWSTTILSAINEYERSLNELAALGDSRITEDRRNGKGTCPVCGTRITHMAKYGIAQCDECTKPFMAAHAKLDGDQGFCTWAI
jgi:hypothetical protein